MTPYRDILLHTIVLKVWRLIFIICNLAIEIHSLEFSEDNGIVKAYFEAWLVDI